MTSTATPSPARGKNLFGQKYGWGPNYGQEPIVPQTARTVSGFGFDAGGQGPSKRAKRGHWRQRGKVLRLKRQSRTGKQPDAPQPAQKETA